PDGGASAGLGGRNAGAAAAGAARPAARPSAPLAADARAARAAVVGRVDPSLGRARVRPAVGRALGRRARARRGGLVPLPAIHARFWPAITRRQEPPS